MQHRYTHTLETPLYSCVNKIHKLLTSNNNPTTYTVYKYKWIVNKFYFFFSFKSNEMKSDENEERRRMKHNEEFQT